MSTSYIPWSHFVASAPALVGGQNRINHVHCSAGVDLKLRLYIKRVPGGVLAYCHNCGLAGSWFNKEESESSRLRRYVLSGGSRGEVINVERTGNKTEVRDITSLNIKMWLNTHYVNNQFDFFQEDEHGNMVMPIYSINKSTIGEQTRIFPPNVGPKYITNYFNGNTEAGWVYSSGSNNNVLFITEDITSSYRIHQDINYSGMALLKTSMSKCTEREILQFVENYQTKKIVVWLDSDKAGLEGGLKIFNRLQVICPNQKLLSLTGIQLEPKLLTPSDLVLIKESSIA